MIPKAQEEVSVDSALTGSVKSLPDELLSMLFEAPTISVMSQAHLDDGVWLDLRSYLLSWKTVFDHFSNAVSPPLSGSLGLGERQLTS